MSQPAIRYTRDLEKIGALRSKLAAHNFLNQHVADELSFAWARS